MKPYPGHQSKYPVLKKIMKGCHSPAMLKVEKIENKMRTNQQKLQCSVSVDELLAFLNFFEAISCNEQRPTFLKFPENRLSFTFVVAFTV